MCDGGVAPRFLDLGTRRVMSGQLHVLAVLPQEKELPKPIGSEAEWDP
jgi:hypothetical protein